MDDCKGAVELLLKELGTGFVCRERDGVIWLVTPYRLPDGDLIEVALVTDASGQWTVTDFGETARFLANHGFDPSATIRGKQALEEIVKRTGVDPLLPELRKTVPSGKLGEALFDVILACLALGDTLYLSRAYQRTHFIEEVELTLLEKRLRWTKNKEVPGSSGRSYRVHFALPVYDRGIVTGEALLHALTARRPAEAKRVVDAAARMWFDIGNDRWRGSVLDDRFFGWAEEDVRLLTPPPRVYLWSKREVLLCELADFTRQGHNSR